MHIKLTNGQPENYSIGQLRRDNPNVSFPKNPPDSLLAEWDVYPLVESERPDYDNLSQKISESSPILSDGKWTQQWVVENLPQEDAENRVRSRRNALLSDCDWTQVADAPVDQAVWATYRQALRDLTSQEGFPFNVTWPTKPE